MDMHVHLRSDFPVGGHAFDTLSDRSWGSFNLSYLTRPPKKVNRIFILPPDSFLVSSYNIRMNETVVVQERKITNRHLRGHITNVHPLAFLTNDEEMPEVEGIQVFILNGNLK